nr:MAG TPA: hypothetical protein [Caudoviricetes sp.]
MLFYCFKSSMPSGLAYQPPYARRRAFNLYTEGGGSL